MSTQISNPLATYKILNAIDVVKTITENVMDYYVEMISIASGDNVNYEYRIYVNYINGIKMVGRLYTYPIENNTNNSLITTEQIPGVILSNGKLFSTSGLPYYIEIRDVENIINQL